MTTRTFTLVHSTAETDRIKRLVLRAEGGPAPEWEAGAHMRVHLPSGGSRAYSLLRLPGLGPAEIALGVLLESESTGGSRHMHSLAPGAELELSGPFNHFPIEQHDSPALLLAGGIGITPLLSMAAQLAQDGRAYALHFAGRTASALAFLTPLAEICGEAMTCHHDDETSALDIPALLAQQGHDTHLYVCGPAGMIDAARKSAEDLGWDKARVHFELFSNEAVSAEAADATADQAFEVEIHATGQIIPVAANQSIIEALEDAGLDPLYDCQRGDCGICQVDVIAGEPDHRDVILTEAERESNKVMQICVSRSKGPRLVLDL